MLQASPLAAADFERFVRLNAAPQFEGAGARSSARSQVVGQCARWLAQPELSSEALLACLPKLLGEAFLEFGWAWNGFYGLRDDGHLHLSFAHGPPVCSQLESSGAALSSGMCFDSLALNQTLAAFRTKDWPGYVSCDATSQLGTAAGIVVPIRDPRGTPIGCWDLDSIQPIEGDDVRFMDVLISSLARCVEFHPRSFGEGF